MRLGIVGWVADSGVGREAIDALRHLPVSSLFCLRNENKPTRKDLISPNIRTHFVSNSKSEVEQMDEFLRKTEINTILTWEVPGHWNFPAMWKERKIRWVHVIHWDWFSHNHDHIWRMADVLVAPNRMCQHLLKERYALESTYLPVPIDTDLFVFNKRTRADRFVSVYGYGGFNQRRSLPELFQAWAAIKNPPPLVIRAQVQPPELKELKLPKNVTLSVGNTPEPKDLYTGMDVAVQPSRYEGLGLSMLEAQTLGVPVISVDAPPMNEIVPSLRVSVKGTEEIQLMGKKVTSFIPSWESIKERVESLQGQDISKLSEHAHQTVMDVFSWNVLMTKWLSVLSGN